MAALLIKLNDAGYEGPISAEVEFDDKGWPDYAGCLAGGQTLGCQPA